ncbi:MAG: hypothetical protein J6S25_01915, partial [Aeriscardovia sp.]|nr:hypothetical protein [Aeriscardovia sp.]
MISSSLALDGSEDFNFSTISWLFSTPTSAMISSSSRLDKSTPFESMGLKRKECLEGREESVWFWPALESESGLFFLHAREIATIATKR